MAECWECSGKGYITFNWDGHGSFKKFLQEHYRQIEDSTMGYLRDLYRGEAGVECQDCKGSGEVEEIRDYWIPEI